MYRAVRRTDLFIIIKKIARLMFDENCLKQIYLYHAPVRFWMESQI
jgi:hypothetical protein